MRSARATRSVRAVRAVLRPLDMSLDSVAGGVLMVEPIGAVEPEPIVPVVALEPVAPVAPMVPWVVTVVPLVPGCIVALFVSTRALSGVGTVVCA